MTYSDDIALIDLPADPAPTNEEHDMGALTLGTVIDTPDLLLPGKWSVWSQAGETYKFVADFDPALYPDANWALLAPGVSEDWTDTSLYLNHTAAWKSGQMYRAKLTRGQFTETAVKTLLYP